MAKLTLIQGGRSAAQRFETLVRPHYGALYAVGYRLTGSAHDAEDLAQETCVRAFQRLERIAELDNPRTWLLCVLRRLFIDQTRRYERTNVTSLETAAEASLADEGSDVVEQAEAALGSRRLAHAWIKLDREQRILLVLHDIEGYTLAELIEITGLKVGTIKSRLHRARIKLGRLMRYADSPAGFSAGKGAS
jgi:RNA polymerase sigma-70 factor (ECF subfamily)